MCVNENMDQLKFKNWVQSFNIFLKPYKSNGHNYEICILCLWLVIWYQNFK